MYSRLRRWSDQLLYNIDVVYVDFSKAFDSIVFWKLLAKLEQCGI